MYLHSLCDVSNPQSIMLLAHSVNDHPRSPHSTCVTNQSGVWMPASSLLYYSNTLRRAVVLAGQEPLTFTVDGVDGFATCRN